MSHHTFFKSKKLYAAMFIALFSFAFCPPSGAWVNAESKACNTAEINGGYANDMLKVMAKLSVDGNPLDTEVGVGSVNVGYSGPMAAGTHVAVVDGYAWEKVANGYYKPCPPGYSPWGANKCKKNSWPGTIIDREWVPEKYDWVWKTNAVDEFAVEVCHTSVMIDVGECTWPGGDKSVTPIGVSMDDGVLLVEIKGPEGFDVVLTENGSVDTDNPGDYNWVATAEPGFVFDGPSEGSFTTKACPPEAPQCPACAPRTPQPVLQGHYRVNWFGVTSCRMVNGCQEFQGAIRITTIDVRPRLVIPATCDPASGKCTLIEGTLRKGADGITYGSLYYEYKDPNFRIIGEDNEPLWKTLKMDPYFACQVATSYADTDEAGIAYYNPGATENEWALWLVEQGYFKTYDEARVWTNELRVKGSLALPAKPAV
jgi:hypothetical protein